MIQKFEVLHKCEHEEVRHSICRESDIEIVLKPQMSKDICDKCKSKEGEKNGNN